MATTKQQWITLDSIINDFLDENDLGMHVYSKIFNIMFRGMDQLGINFFYEIRTFKLPVLSNKTAVLPANSLNWVKFGILNSIGELVPLKHNPNLTNYASLIPDRISKVEDGVNFADFLNPGNLCFPNYYYNGAFGNLYGIPSGATFIGSFNVDDNNGVVILDPNFNNDYIMIVCVVSPQEGQEYFVPMQFREALIEWAAWRNIKNNASIKKGFIGARRDYERNYYNARRLANASYKPFRKEEAYQLSVESNRLTVKI